MSEEHEVSAARAVVMGVLDTLQAELKRRYKDDPSLRALTVTPARDAVARPELFAVPRSAHRDIVRATRRNRPRAR